jgi:4-amino-4-deoxy-L-arabinose transferase-like glycosyltransferase
MKTKLMSVNTLLLLAALSFIPTLFFYTVGEEGIYTISSMEMWFNNNWLIQTMYGYDLHRPPLMNWLVIPIADLIGWTHVLFATRLVSVIATLGTIGWLFWLSRRLFGDQHFALFTALAGLAMADLSLYRGWLAYTDPIFAFFTFGAMATLWVATIERHRGWLLLSVVLVSCALLTKAFTAYIFYGTAAFVLLWNRDKRVFLLSLASLLIFSLALVTPFIWFTSLPQTSGHSGSMFGEILQKLSAQNAAAYFKHFLLYPFETLFRLSPAALLAIYLLLRKRVTHVETLPLPMREAILITLLCLLPYWLSPQGGIRYLLPIYPFVALIAARFIWRADATALALRWFAALIVFKFVFALFLFPWYQNHFRGANYVHAAHDIVIQAGAHPLYVNDPRSVSENIVSEIDLRRLPHRPPLTQPPAEWNSGFLLSMEADNQSTVFSKLIVDHDELYLLCRGEACNTPRTINKNDY